MNDTDVGAKPMTTAGGAKIDGEQKLPRRDWFLLPAIGILTVLVIAVTGEAIGTLMIPRQGKPLTACLVQNDPTTGIRGVPNSTCWNRLLEGPLVENDFNRCGDRTPLDCDHRAPDTYRVVLAGSSFVFGLGVDNKTSLATVLSSQLSEDTGKKIEVYNVGMEGKYARSIATHFDHVLAAHPDMILWVVTPTDIKNASFMTPDVDHPAPAKTNAAPKKHAGTIAQIQGFLREEFATKSISGALADISDATRAGYLLRHYLYESQSLYVRNYLMGTDDSGSLRAQMDDEWQARMDVFNRYAAQIVSQAKAAGVPLAVVLAPARAQTAMISMNDWPAGFDPYALDRTLSTFFTAQGVTYLDILPGFRTIPNPEQYYQAVDGHPNAGGHQVIAKLVAGQLVSGVVPQLKAASPAPAGGR